MEHWDKVLTAAAAKPPSSSIRFLCATTHPTTADFYLYVLLEGFARGYKGIVGPLVGESADMQEYPALRTWWTRMNELYGGPASEGFDEAKWVWSPTHRFNGHETLEAALRGSPEGKEKECAQPPGC